MSSNCSPVEGDCDHRSLMQPRNKLSGACVGIADHNEGAIYAEWRQNAYRLGAHGKGAGSGALTDLPKDKIGDNMILSNRDKAQHSDIRGLDGKFIQTEQYQDHSANRLTGDVEAED